MLLELVQSTDSKFDLQLRMWQQFMRVPTSSVHLSFKPSYANTIESEIDTHILTKQDNQVRLLESNEDMIDSGLNKTSRFLDV